MKTISVQVQPDHLQTMSRVRKPIIAVAELIWNGLDADADQVRVRFAFGKLGGLESITISDNGHGMTYEEALKAFQNLGGSWKRDRPKTKKKRRLLHGRLGKGRFRAFALGASVEWTFRFSEDHQSRQFKVTGQRSNLGRFQVSDPLSCEPDEIGTDVIISEFDKNYPSIMGRGAIQEITEHFALYLRKYQKVSITYDGERVDPREIEERVTEYNLEPIGLTDGREEAAKLTVIEWKTPDAQRSLVLCDADGFALQEVPPGIQAPNFNFTAYLRSNVLRELDDQNALVLEELHPDLKGILDAAKGKLRDHFRTRAAESASNKVEEWKQQRIYPFEGSASNILEKTKREVFDVCALNLSAYLPDFEKSDTKSKRLALRLLKHALESDPSAVRRILEDVLDLPPEKQQELSDLLKKTTLAAIINASKVVADRLNFLAGLEILVFREDSREVLLERRQLHRIVADQTWLFGEEFNLSVDDDSLTQVLNKHLEGTQKVSAISGAVQREDGTEGIVDLMLSRRIPYPRADHREHLVIELKRPRVKIDQSAVTQVQSYAFAIADDERFKGVDARWTFWAVSNEISDTVQRMGRQRNRPEGLVFEDEEGRIAIWVQTWAQLIGAARARLCFFQEKLEYAADTSSALAFLHATHEKYLPQPLKRQAG